MDQIVSEGTVDLISQAAYARFHDSGSRVEVVVPDMLHYHRLRDNPASIPHKVLQQCELFRL